MRRAALLIACLGCGSALASLDQLDPPVTAQEAVMYERIRDKPDEVRKFVATRKFYRRLAKNPCDPGVVPADISFGYAVSLSEQLAGFKLKLHPDTARSSKGAAGGAISQTVLGKAPPLSQEWKEEYGCDGVRSNAELGPPSESHLAGLKPPATAEERERFRTVRNDENTIRKFLATRHYMRRLQANPNLAAPLPKDFDYRFTLTVDEQQRTFKINTTHAGKNRPARSALRGEVG